MTTTCACGKPAEHVHANPDGAEWACRVPDFDRMTGRLSAQSERRAPRQTHYGPDPYYGHQTRHKGAASSCPVCESEDQETAADARQG